MEADTRLRSAWSGPEKEMLVSFLEFQRQSIIWKVSGLSDEQACVERTPSGMTLLGIVKHLAYVERNWFQYNFLGQDVAIPWHQGDPDADFRIEPGETRASVVAFYQAECARSNEIVAACDSLDTLAKSPNRPRSLRWIMLHMIEETARHVGHADLLREATDGQTGE